jgi:hypothetical protein
MHPDIVYISCIYNNIYESRKIKMIYNLEAFAHPTTLRAFYHYSLQI